MILIAGGAGYIGSHTNKLLHQRGHETVVFDNLSCGHREFVRWGEFCLGDIADAEALRGCFQKYPIEAVMHFCAFTNVGESVAHPGRYYRNNVANTLQLLEVMKEFEVRDFIFSSTCATYGMPQEIPISESHPQQPINPYGRSKLMVERILDDFEAAHGIRHVNLRYFNAAGADPEGEIGERHDPETHLIPLTIQAAQGTRKNISIFGTDYPTADGTCVRDYIHVNDLADAHIRALEFLRENGRSESFNLGNGDGCSVRKIIDVVREVSGRDFPVLEAARRPGDPPVLISDSARAHTVLSWKPAIADIREIIQTAWRWHSRKSSA